MKLFVLLFLFVSSVMAQPDKFWNRVVLSGGQHLMMGFVPPELERADVLNIFIEGDGKPGIALDMAIGLGGNSVYIARPCQYMIGNHLNSCNKELWTSHRYSQAVIDSMNRAVTAMKIRYRADTVRLIGFSGGGAIASILASKRGDVALLVTVAGNLDHQKWTELNHSEPLTGSLNPADFSKSLENVPQIHLIGENDDVVPGKVLSSYLSRMHRLDNVKSYVVEGADHTCCWNVAVAQYIPAH